jgi:hypothetical protein
VFVLSVSIYILQTTRNWALLEKPPTVQPLENFPTIYENRRFIAALIRALHWSLS